jgi:hypothetical protein
MLDISIANGSPATTFPPQTFRIAEAGDISARMAMLATRPAPTGSETIGIVCVSPHSNAVTGVEFARTTSG